MLRTISAALLAVSVIAAPALAETATKTTPAPVSKTSQAPLNKTTQAPVIKADQSKSKAMNANARIGYHKHYQGRGQARLSGRQARLKLIRRRGLTPHCPHRARGYPPAHVPLLPQWPWAGARPDRNNRDANSISPPGGL